MRWWVLFIHFIEFLTALYMQRNFQFKNEGHFGTVLFDRRLLFCDCTTDPGVLEWRCLQLRASQNV
tara:strand:- start:79 stop:276 length:198 start_codon:yes stop_codon:yes gene_type:complete